MAWYIIYRNQEGSVAGFIIDEDGDPVSYDTERAAEESMQGHILEPFAETIEL